MVHLICLRCSHANPADAKFCGQCGAGLLRRFCAGCHAVNDAESHFCQSCGAALPASSPGVSAAKPPPPDSVLPSLTDVAYLGPDLARQPVLDTAAAPGTMQVVEVPQSLVLAPDSILFPARNAPLPIFRLPIVLGLCAVAAALTAVLLWPAQPERVASKDHSSAPPVNGAAFAATFPAAEASAPGDAVPAEPEMPAPSATALSPRPSNKPVAARATTVPTPPARPPMAPAKSPVPSRAPAAPECTPQVDALGLCAPGAKVVER